MNQVALVKRTSWATLGLMLLLRTTASAAIINGSFESGNLNGWTSLGVASAVNGGAGGVTPPDGLFQASLVNHNPGDDGVAVGTLEPFVGLPAGGLTALGNGDVTQGTALKQTFSAAAGDIFSFQWDFFTNSDVPDPDFNDFAFVVITNQNGSVIQSATLANTTATFTDSPDPLYTSATGYHLYTFPLPSAPGIYTVSIGVADVGDTFVNSAVLVDAVATPEPSGVIGLAAVAGGFCFRRLRPI